MLKIRLQRIGRKNEPHFRAVVTDGTSGPKSGKFIEIVGSYNPKLGEINFKDDRVKYWIANGAQASGTVHNMLVDKKLIDGKKINVLPKKTPIKKEVEETPAAPKAEAPVETPETEEAKVEEETTEQAPVEETPAEEPAPTTDEAPAVEEVSVEEPKAE